MAFTGSVLLDLIFGRAPEVRPTVESLPVGERMVPLRLVRHPRARRYLLRLLPDGTAQVTVPRRGTLDEARKFAARQTRWLEKQLQRLRDKPVIPTEWVVGNQILFRGESVTIQRLTPESIQLGAETVLTRESANLRPAIQKHLHRLALRELPLRVRELAQQHDILVTGISVRNQRTRWGSCSRHGRISLNWRIIQLPAFVSDYIILHELMHRRQLNHSPKFWREVLQVCPEYEKAECWLKQHSALLG